MTETYLVHAAGPRPNADHQSSVHGRPGMGDTTSWMHNLGSGLTALLAGLADGFRAYRCWQMLATTSDVELARMGIDRRDLPRQAMFGHVPGQVRR